MIRLRTVWWAVCGTAALGGCASMDNALPQPDPTLVSSVGYQNRRISSDSRSERLPAGTEDTPVAAPPLIDLETALRLGGVNNPTINLARERVQEALAGQLAARARLLPSVNVGGNFRHHSGALIASSGIVRTVDLRSLYLGAGAGMIGGGSPAVPGVQLFANLGDAAYEPLAARQRVTARRAESQAVQNAILLDVALAYLRLVEAEARRDVLRGGVTEAAEVVRLTAVHAEAGQGRQADANRGAANADLLRRDLRRAEEEVAVASAGLCRLLSLDPSEPLQTAPGFPQPIRLIPEDSDPEALTAEALRARPEIPARSAAVAEAQIRARQQRVRPWLPTVSVGYSAGGFGGSARPADFGPLAGRSTFDAVAAWNVQGLGFGNRAQVRRADAAVGASVAGFDVAVNQIRREVAESLADARAAARQITTAETAVGIAEEGYRLERERIQQAQGRPIEVLDSLRQLIESRQELVRAVVAFDAAQFRLFVAVGGNPSADPNCAPVAQQK